MRLDSSLHAPLAAVDTPVVCVTREQQRPPTEVALETASHRATTAGCVRDRQCRCLQRCAVRQCRGGGDEPSRVAASILCDALRLHRVHRCVTACSRAANERSTHLNGQPAREADGSDRLGCRAASAAEADEQTTACREEQHSATGERAAQHSPTIDSASEYGKSASSGRAVELRRVSKQP